jgi:hypothetical protein
VDAIRSLIRSQTLGQSSPDALDLGDLQRGSAPAGPGALDALLVVLEVGVAEGLGVCRDPNIGEAGLHRVGDGGFEVVPRPALRR